MAEPAQKGTQKAARKGTPKPDQETDRSEELSYEQAREELVDVVRRLEQGGEGLADSIALWERGEKLAQICQTWLDGARQRLDRAMTGDDQRD